MRCLALLLALCILVEASPAFARTIYRDPKWGVELRAATDFSACKVEGKNDLRGFFIDLEPSAKSSTCAEQRASLKAVLQGRVSTFSVWSERWDGDSPLGAFRRNMCSLPDNRCARVPPGLALKGLPSMTARFDPEKGHIYILVVAQAVSGAKGHEAMLTYNATLNTTADAFAKDLVSFREILAGLSITPPKPMRPK
jgi:hypothetical protein